MGGAWIASSSHNRIEYLAIGTPGTGVDFGDRTVAYSTQGVASDGSRAVAGGGSANDDTMDYVTIATPGNAVDFSEISVAGYGTSACSDGSRGVWGSRVN